MKSIKSINLIFILIVLPFCIFSQKDYQSGYIATNENDTIFGFVKDRKQPPYGKLYKKIYFKIGRKKKKYGPDQIMAYKQGNDNFESLWIQENTYPFQGIYLSKPNYGNKSFLKVIKKGYLTYYHWEFEDAESDYIDFIGFFKRKGDYFLARASQGIFGLKKKSLGKYFQDCPELVSEINNGNIKDPIQIVIYYNLWKNSIDD